MSFWECCLIIILQVRLNFRIFEKLNEIHEHILLYQGIDIFHWKLNHYLRSFILTLSKKGTFIWYTSALLRDLFYPERSWRRNSKKKFIFRWYRVNYSCLWIFLMEGRVETAQSGICICHALISWSHANIEPLHSYRILFLLRIFACQAYLNFYALKIWFPIFLNKVLY